METGVQIAAQIYEAVRSGRDLYVRDQLIEGPDRLERARKLLIEQRDACLDPDEVVFLNSIISELEKGNDDALCGGQ